MSKTKPRPAAKVATDDNDRPRTAEEQQADANQQRADADKAAREAQAQARVDDARLQVETLKRQLAEAEAELARAEDDQGLGDKSLQDTPKCLPQHDPTLRSARTSHEAAKMVEVARSNDPVVKHLSDPNLVPEEVPEGAPVEAPDAPQSEK